MYRKVEDYIGKKINHLTILKDIGFIKKDRWVLTQCDCPDRTVKQVRFRCLFDKRERATLSCGCLNRKNHNPNYKVEDFIGKKINHLTVLEEVGRKVERWVRVKCDCGVIKELRFNTLLRKNSKTTSCGCQKPITTRLVHLTHGKTKTKEFKCWQHIRDRCYKTNNTHYLRYGGRGITVCDRWLESFENFYEDMGTAPTSKHTIERIDNDAGYFKDNCRWATYKEQANNKNNNRKITFRGITKNLSQWAEELGIDRVTILARIDKYSWSTERALTSPVRAHIEYRKETKA
jgi:hypothetical protein